MSVLDRLLALGERLLTIDAEMRRQSEIVNEMKQKTDRLTELMQDRRERLARLKRLVMQTALNSQRKWPDSEPSLSALS
jgi:hypothetical protein